MYTAPIEFKFTEETIDSKRMKLLSEMFCLSEAKGIKSESYGGYKISCDGKVSFWSYYPGLTTILTSFSTKMQPTLQVALDSHRLEALSGNRNGQYSIRINQQYRICFKWGDSVLLK